MERDLVLGFMKLHLLHHAAQAPIFGIEMLRELAEHGYTVSPGTLSYPSRASRHSTGATCPSAARSRGSLAG